MKPKVYVRWAIFHMLSNLSSEESWVIAMTLCGRVVVEVALRFEEEL
jgi:hypothetical protein